MRDGTRLDQRDPGDVVGIGGLDVEGAGRLGHHRHRTAANLTLQHRTLRQRTVGIEQVRRTVDLGVQVVDRTRLTTTGGQDRGIRQQQGHAVIEAFLADVGARRPLTGVGVEEHRGVVDLACILVDGLFDVDQQVLGRTARDQHVAVGQDRGIAPVVGLFHGRQVEQLGTIAVDVDQRGLGRTAVVHVAGHVTATELEDQARTNHDGRGGGLPAAVELPVFLAVFGDARIVPVGTQHLHRALAGIAIRIDLVHEVRVEAEDLAVRGNEVARIVVLERCHLVGANLDLGQRVDGQRLEGAVGLADLGVLLTVGTALDVDLTGGQRGGRAVPARQRHVVARRGKHVAGRIEDVDILHATVGDATILQQVTAQDHHPAVLQQDLRGTEQEGLGGVEQQHVGRIVRAQLGIPHVVAELAVLPDVVVRTVGEHPTVGRDGGMDGNHRPVHFGQPFPPGLACLLFGRRGGRDRLGRLGRRGRGNRRDGRLGNFRCGLRRRLNHRRHGAHGSNRRSGGTGTRGAVGSRRGRLGIGSRTGCSGIGRSLVARRRGGIGRGVAARLRGGIRRGDGVASTALGTRAGSGGARGGRTGITAATAACSQYGQHGKRGKLEGRRRDSHGDQSKRVKDVRRKIRDAPGKRWTPCRGHARGAGAVWQPAPTLRIGDCRHHPPAPAFSRSKISRLHRSGRRPFPPGVPWACLTQAET